MLVEAEYIKNELKKVGISINDIYDLVNSKKPYPEAIPVLLKLLKSNIEHKGLKEGVIRSLAVKEAIGKASPILLEEYNKTPKEQVMLRWAIGNSVYTTFTSDDVNQIIKIVKDKTNGISRQMFVMALGKVKSTEVEDVLIDLLSDEEVCPHALDALGKLKSKKAKDKISILLKHPNKLIKKEAEKALKKL